MNKREKVTARVSLVVITIIATLVAYVILKNKEEFFPIAMQWIFGIVVVLIYTLWAKAIVNYLKK